MTIWKVPVVSIPVSNLYVGEYLPEKQLDDDMEGPSGFYPCI
jgi:hypothetical protein